MKIKLITRDGGFVRDAEIPPFTPPPEVVTWGTRVFVHGLAHHPDALKRGHRDDSPSPLPLAYIEGLMYPLEAADAFTSADSADPSVSGETV